MMAKQMTILPEGSIVAWNGDPVVHGMADVVAWGALLAQAAHRYYDHISVISGDITQIATYGSGEWIAWGEKRVYFPAGYDGTFWVASVPLKPCGEKTFAIGGGV